MLGWLLILACGGPEAVELPATVPGSTTPTPETGPPEIPCEPMQGTPGPGDLFTDGRRLRLDVTQTSTELLLRVSRAEPEERVLLHVGGLGALDCPPERDGACFLGVDSAVVGEVRADAAGLAELAVPIDDAWSEGWLVLQATAPDGCAISQAVVDRILTSGWHEPIAAWPDPTWIGPMTLNNQYGVREAWAYAAPAGRRVVITSVEDAWGEVLVTATTGSTAEYSSGGALWSAAPTTYYVYPVFSYDTASTYAIDIDTAPLDVPVPWYPDADGDGFGDASGATVLSTVPVPAASPDATDCDDTNGDVRPFGLETCDDGIDQDCDGVDRPCAAVLPSPTGSGTLLIGRALSVVGLGLQLGDLDGDGNADVAALGGNGAPGAVWSVGRTDATPSWSFPPAPSIAVGDVTGDAQRDLVLLSRHHEEYGETWVLAGPLGDDPTDAPAARISTVGWNDPVGAVGDVSGDGIGDLVVLEGSGSAFDTHVFYGPLVGDVTVADVHLQPADVTRAGVAVGDADGDGLDDVWTPQICLFLAPLAAADAEPAGCVDDGFVDGFGDKGLVVGDIDGDGLEDVTAGGSEGAFVILGPLTGDQSVADGAWLRILDDDGLDEMYVATTPDRDGDGAPEVILSTVSRVRVVSAPSGGTLDHDAGVVLQEGSFVEGIPTPVQGGDVDGDGVGEILIADPHATHDTFAGAGVVHLLWGL